VTLLKAKLIAKKVWLGAKKFWWVIILGMLFVCAALIGALTRNGALLAGVLDLLESKRESHKAEVDTLTRIHDTEVAEKNKRLEEHLKRRAQLEEEFKKRGEELDAEKEAELKRLVDEGYNDPEKLAQDLADAFGLK
jgi:biopolymer transport protein ExbB/TolQ